MNWLFAASVIVIIICCSFGTANGECADQDIGVVAEELVLNQHRLDSLNLLLFLFLLVLTILTIWLFKQHRFRFMHETGLAMIYGVIIGAVIWYTADTKEQTPKVHTDSMLCSDEVDPPDSIYLELQYPNESVFFVYDREEVIKNPDLNKTRTINNFGDRISFDPELFFNILLPPIIFHAGYSLKRRHFFRNLGSIMTFAFLGTCISCLTVGGIVYCFAVLVMGLEWFTAQDCFFFGALISATDPVTVLAVFHDLNVDVDMYILVFGESVLNDAVAIVLTKTVEDFGDEFSGLHFLRALGSFCGIFLGAFGIGSLMGCATALVTKFTHIRDFPLLETALFCIMSYMSYLLAEALQLTGIVAVLFCGVTQAHYTYNNLSDDSKKRTREVFELLNFLAESFIFSYMGLSMFNPANGTFNPGFIAAAFLGIILGRALNIYPLSFLLNIRRKTKIPWNFQHMLMFSGLRGAIAFGLAIRNTATDARQMTLTTTLIIVLVTVVVLGGLTTQMLTWLNIKVGVDYDEGATTSLHSAPGTITEQESRIRRRKEQAWVVKIWYDFDYKVLKPVLTRKGADLRETWPGWCLPITEYLTVEDDQLEEDSDTDFILEEQESSEAPVDGASGPNGTTKEGSTSGEENTADGDLGLGDHQLAVRGLNDPPPEAV